LTKNEKKHEALCPFCSKEISRPSRAFKAKHTTFEGGHCLCGAIFLVDSTGRNMGEVFMNAMSILDIADKMYESEYESNYYAYDQFNHHIIKKKKKAARYRGNKILFVKVLPSSPKD